MKKLMLMALCGLAVCTAGAQKANVDQAKKLSGKPDKIGEARTLIGEALKNPETANQALTYYTAGKIEWDAFDKSKLALSINPNDDKINPDDMGEELINGYQYFVAMLPLDSLPNEKGQVKPKYSKDVLNAIKAKQNDFFDAGANFFNSKKYYPQAYNAFMIYGDIPEAPYFGDPSKAPYTPDTIRATAYFNAGLAAWSGNQVDAAAVAFNKARKNNYPGPDAYIYEIACWQNISQRDSARTDEAANHIVDVAKNGLDKFGMAQPIFLNNLINFLVNNNQGAQALAEINEYLAAYPDNANLYGLRGFINDRMGNDADSEADYRKAATISDVDSETLKLAGRKIFRLGQQKWNDLDMSDKAGRETLKTNYFLVSKEMLDRAKSLNPNDHDIDNILDNVNYTLETYF